MKHPAHNVDGAGVSSFDCERSVNSHVFHGSSDCHSCHGSFDVVASRNFYPN